MLRLLGRLGPVDALQIAQQAVDVLRDPKEPLRDAPLLDGRATSFTTARDHLLVGQHRHAGGAPIDGSFLPHGQPGIEELDEDPLRPAVVVRVGRVDGVAPVEHPADAPQLSGEVGDIPGDEVHRIDALRQGEVLRVDPERVESDRLEHALAGEPLEAPMDVGAGERVDVAHMKPLGGGVGEHHQLVVTVLGGLKVFESEAVGAQLLPLGLPLGFDLGRRVSAVSFAAHLYLEAVCTGPARGPCSEGSVSASL